MRKSLYTDKRAVSEMISYVLLIVIAVAISVVVYAYLQVLTPKDKPECSEDIALSVVSAVCHASTAAKQLNVTLRNKGLFTVDAAYIRIGSEGRVAKTLVNADNVFFGVVGGNTGLIPEEEIFRSYNFKDDIVKSGSNILEIQPAVGTPQKFALCEKAVIKHPIACT